MYKIRNKKIIKNESEKKKMSQKTEFINYVAGLIENNPMSDEAKAYWDVFSNTPEVEKPLLTDNGRLVLGYMQKKEIGETITAKALAEEIFASSRTVSGAMRKLVTDGFVEKVGQDPVYYSITEKGKNITID